jgi:hypothetical protein
MIFPSINLWPIAKYSYHPIFILGITTSTTKQSLSEFLVYISTDVSSMILLNILQQWYFHHPSHYRFSPIILRILLPLANTLSTSKYVTRRRIPRWTKITHFPKINKKSINALLNHDGTIKKSTYRYRLDNALSSYKIGSVVYLFLIWYVRSPPSELILFFCISWRISHCKCLRINLNDFK